MNAREANTVLSYCVAADQRLASADADQAKARTQVWADLLAEVDAQYALDHVRRYYSRHRDWPITPGAVRDAWVSHCRAEEAKTRALAIPAGGVQREPSPAAEQALADARARIGEAQQRFLAGRPRHPRPLQHPLPADG